MQTKSSFRRFSDALQSGGSSSNPTLGGKKDLWLVVFNDVVLRCQRTGTTTLPMATSSPASAMPAGKANSLPELQAKAKNSTVGRRNVQTKPRNLYKFLKVQSYSVLVERILTAALPDRTLDHWGCSLTHCWRSCYGRVSRLFTHLHNIGHSFLSSESISRARSRIGEETQKPCVEHDEEDVSDDSDRKSKMSFSYWGADKVTVQTSDAKARGKQAAKNAISARRGLVPVAYVSAPATVHHAAYHLMTCSYPVHCQRQIWISTAIT